MEKEVIISIKGMQRYEDSPTDTIELVTQGRLQAHEQGGYTLSYQESKLTGLEGTRTTFQIEPERITLMREGEVNSQMVFQQGQRHLSMYSTPYGDLAVGINTRHLLQSRDGAKGRIEIDYAIEIDHAVAGHNVFEIDFKETLGDCPIPQ